MAAVQPRPPVLAGFATAVAPRARPGMLAAARPASMSSPCPEIADTPEAIGEQPADPRAVSGRWVTPGEAGIQFVAAGENRAATPPAPPASDQPQATMQPPATPLTGEAHYQERRSRKAESARRHPRAMPGSTATGSCRAPRP